MIVLKSELIKYKNNTIIKEVTDRRINKIQYFIINTKNLMIYL